MVQYSSRLDASFAALSDATRRGVIEQLWRQDASITELAERFHMTLTGRIAAERRPAIFEALRERLSALDLSAVEIGSVSLLRQPHRTARFEVIASFDVRSV